MSVTCHSSDGLLPWADWSITEVITSTLEIDGLTLFRAGLTACSGTGNMVSGSAADVIQSPVDRARGELLERASIVEAMGHHDVHVVRTVTDEPVGVMAHARVFPESTEPGKWQYSRSNGVALASDWSAACRSAAHELIERDRLLRSWYGGGPKPLPIAQLSGPLTRVRSHRWQAFRFPAHDGWSAASEVVLVIGFPLRDDVPLVRGSAAAATLAEAVMRACRECLQGLAFLWGEPIPREPPEAMPTPIFHLDYFLWPESHQGLKAWLAGAEDRWRNERGSAAELLPPVFVDLTPKHAAGRFRVAKAVCDQMLPLTFGDIPPWISGDMPHEMRVHPVA